MSEKSKLRLTKVLQLIKVLVSARFTGKFELNLSEGTITSVKRHEEINLNKI